MKINISRKKINLEKIYFFTSQLSILLKSGITFSEALKILIKSEKNKTFKSVIENISRNILKGKSIFESFKNFENVFSKNYLHMLKIGETSGNINDILDTISKNIETHIEFKKKMKSFLIYPIVVITLAFTIVFFLITFILPTFISIFEENSVELPLITKILFFISNNFYYILSFLVIIILLFTFLLSYINSNQYRKFKKDRFLFKIPIFKNFLMLNITNNFYYSLAILLNSGMSFMESLDIITENNENLYFQKNVKDIKSLLLKGEKISDAFKKINFFPEKFNSLIVAGEESGFISENFLQISKICSSELNYFVKKFVSLIEPLTIIFLGFIIGFIILAIYLPIFSIGNIF